MRLCSKCKTRPALKPKGPARCSECATTRPLRRRECVSCGRRFTTKGGNYTCPSCKHQAAKHPCADCGVLVDKRAERCMPCWGAAHTGPASNNWNGGRVRSHRTRGYVRVLVPDHPRAAANGYVPEHTLVMEEMLGRYLLPGENVHHRNGVRDDNRPQNLELWVKFQPAGQRASDLLDWAREIIERYEPVEPVLTERRRKRSRS